MAKTKPASAATEKPGFWTSLPGILTGIAAVITAVALLIPGKKEPEKPAAASPAATPAVTPTAPPTSGSTTVTVSGPGAVGVGTFSGNGTINAGGASPAPVTPASQPTLTR